MRHLSIALKIKLGYAICLLFFVISGLVSYKGIQTLSNGFSQYSELSHKATLSGNIQVHFLQMRLASERYLESLDDQYEANYQSSKLAIDELLNNLIQTTTNTDSLSSLQLVQDSVAAFDAAYSSMKQSQLLIDQLVNVEMVTRETNALKAAQSLLYESYNNNDPNASLYAGMLMENFLAAKITVLSYSNNNDLKAYEAGKDIFEYSLPGIEGDIESLKSSPYQSELIEDFTTEAATFKILRKQTNWNTGNYNILYTLKEFILKTFSYVAIPMKHAIQKEELERVAQNEFLPGDIAAIQRYGKLSNLVFKGNWTHGLIYIGKHSSFAKYFDSDDETNQLYKEKCLREELNCSTFMQYLSRKYPKHMKEYAKSEQDGRPFVTIEGLKPGVVFMELAPSMAWDNLVVLRAKISKKDKALALERTFSSLGKKYDYAFDGNSYSRFVCTELIQFSYESNPYENKKGVDWDQNLVMGKPAMYGFDLVQTYVNQIEDPSREHQLELVIYMKGLSKRKLKAGLGTPEFKTAKRGSFRELKDTL